MIGKDFTTAPSLAWLTSSSAHDGDGHSKGFIVSFVSSVHSSSLAQSSSRKTLDASSQLIAPISSINILVMYSQNITVQIHIARARMRG